MRSSAWRRPRIAILFTLCLIYVFSIDFPSEAIAKEDYRRPIDLVVSPNQSHLAIAYETGRVTLWSLDEKICVQELQLANSLEDLESIDDRWLTTVSKADQKLFLLEWKDSKLQLRGEYPTLHSPHKIEWVEPLKQLRVLSLWGRCVQNFSMDSQHGSLTASTRWDLSFSPGLVRTIPSHQVSILSGAFGNQLEIVDWKSGESQRQHSFLGHAIRSIVPCGEHEIAILCAANNNHAETTENDIHWGAVLSNDMRWIALDRLLTRKGEDVYRGSHLQPVGVPGNGAAELTDGVITRSGKFVIAIGGANQIALGSKADRGFRYLRVGTYPVAISLDREGRYAYIANRFDDTVSILDVVKESVVDSISLGPRRSLSDIEKGELLFHDATLSHDRWMTCASCHVGGHTNGLLSDNLGDRNFGAPKRVLSLLGTKGTEPFNWLGLDPSLTEQISRSIEKTMRSSRNPSNEEILHLSTFIHSLVPPPSVREARKIAISAEIVDGRERFGSLGCIECHRPPFYTTPDTYDVGITDERGIHHFNPPSLRGLSQRGPRYFHDNRAENLEEALRLHVRELGRSISEKELSVLIAFLESL